VRPRVGVYGGTFDPVHTGHLQVAQAVCHAFALDEFLFVPAFIPPHKRARQISAPHHRYAMLVLATMSETTMRVSPVEIEAPARPYTIETLARLQAAAPQSQLFFLMGADSFAEVTTWREHERLLNEYDIIVAGRPGYGERATLTDLTEHLPSSARARVVDLRGGLEPDSGGFAVPRVYLTDYVAAGVASTQVRAAARQGGQVSELVPAAVADYLAKYGLYRNNERNDCSEPNHSSVH